MKPYVPEKLPISGVAWEPLVPLLGRANRALARYDGVLGGIPNPGVLLAPLVTREAVLSSKMEGTRATLGEVLLHDSGEASGNASQLQDIQEISNYRYALIESEKELAKRPFSLNMLLRLHLVLLDGVRGRDKLRGEFRAGQNWIGPPGSTLETATYVPPPPMQVPELLDNWEKYYHLEQPDPLVQLAIVHAQFELIHPFLDGNGRLGRILIPLFLFEKQLLSAPTFYMSAYLEQHREDYLEALRLLNKPGNWNIWIEFFLEALAHQATENTEKAQAIIALYERLKKRVIELTNSRYAVPMLDLIFKTPFFSVSYLTRNKDLPSRPTIMAFINNLKEDKILKELKPGSGPHSQHLALTELINLCEGRKAI